MGKITPQQEPRGNEGEEGRSEERPRPEGLRGALPVLHPGNEERPKPVSAADPEDDEEDHAAEVGLGRVVELEDVPLDAAQEDVVGQDLALFL